MTFPTLSGDFLANSIAFIVAATFFIVIPGPNVALICSQSVAYGLRAGLVTVAGVIAAMVVQLAVVVLGTGTLLVYLTDWFELLRWLGVAYLFYLGLKSWTAPVEPAAPHVVEASTPAVAVRGFLLSVINAHTLLFFAAFLPQFVDPSQDAFLQLVLLSATFLIMGAFFDSAWAVIAARMRLVITARGKLRNRLTGGLLMISAAGLALARRLPVA